MCQSEVAISMVDGIICSIPGVEGNGLKVKPADEIHGGNNVL